ncbi:MAG TPA: hypothetical protein VGP04_08640 [Pseudonocardiaceae bacterium]|nr:hypothetical protein [Pseudonocardiaceae bacterium]
MSPTPIYDQLRGERINADVPATGAEPQPNHHPGKHRLPGGPSSAATVSGLPSPAGADRVASWSWFAPIDPATAAWGPQRALPPTARAQQEQPQACGPFAISVGNTGEISSG